MIELDELGAAGEKLEADLAELGRGLRVIPDAVVAEIHSFGFAEDHATLVIICETTDGDTLFVSVHPGEPVAVSLHEPR
jgi:hypothetical protein